MNLLKKKREDLSVFDDKEIAAYNLELILTQKCNLSCAHCMRGDATNKEIRPEVLDKLFSKFSYIHALSLGGGEISLTPHLVRLVTEKLRQHGTIVHRVDFTSNGVSVTDEFLDALEDLRQYVLDCEGLASFVELDESDNHEPLICCFSFDDFHWRNIKDRGMEVEDIFNNIVRYQERFSEKAIECRLSSDVDIINEGRAKTLKTFIKKVKPIKPNQYKFPYQVETGFVFMGGILTLSCDGEFIPVNIPFAEEKLYSYGNILDEKFSTIASRMGAVQVSTSEEFDKVNNKNMDMMISPDYRWKKYLKVVGNKKYAYFDYLLDKKAQERQ